MRIIPSPLLLIAALTATSACVQNVGRGPDLGACADTPDGTYRYGEVGIGTCLSGPTDLAFVERGGRTWLAVSNADPFMDYAHGSLLLLDWEDVLARIDGGDEVLTVDTLRAEAIPSERFVGAIGYVGSRGLLLQARRLTEAARTRTGPDSAFVWELDTLEPYAPSPIVALEEDPGDFVIDGTRGFALNFTAHTISLLDLRDGPIAVTDLAPGAQLVDLGFHSPSASGAVAELDHLQIGDPASVPDELWTLTWVPEALRVWAPDGTGLDRRSSGGGGFVDAPLADNAAVPGATELWDPAVALPAVDARLDPASTGVELVFADGGALWLTASTGVSDGWQLPTPLLDDAGWADDLSGPSTFALQGAPALAFAGSTDDGLSGIGAAIATETGAYVPLGTPLLTAPQGQRYSQPFAQLDPFTRTARVWFSVEQGGRFHIAHATLDDLATAPLDPGAPVQVLGLDDRSVAAPTVRYRNGAYQLWAARDDGDRWTYVTATSPDGIVWSEPVELFDAPAAYDPARPPRLAVQHADGQRWRVEGRDRGVRAAAAVPTLRLIDGQNGFSLAPISGHEFVPSALFPLGRADGGVVPASLVSTPLADLLYVTAIGDDGRQRLAVLDDAFGDWDVAALDLIPQGRGGNVAGVRAPVVYATGGRFVMFYAGLDTTGLATIHLATSADGRVFTAAGELPVDTWPDFASIQREPHAIEPHEDGSISLWFSGFDGSRWRIGELRITGLDPAAPQLADIALQPGPFNDYQLGTGAPGGADDSGVRHPVVFQRDGQRTMIHACSNATVWSLCVATQQNNAWVRRTQPETNATLPAMQGDLASFALGGVDHPVLRARPDGRHEVFYAGYDTPTREDAVPRLGRAVLGERAIHPALRQPAAGDTLTMQSERGDQRVGAIELAQDVATFVTTGTGTTSMIHDPERGMLYIPSKLSNLLYVVDVRRDTRPGRPDANALDLETVVRFQTTYGGRTGFRGGAIDRARGRLYLTTVSPDGLAVLDLDQIEDNDVKEVTDGAFLGTLPLPSAQLDRGAESVAPIGGAEPLLVGDHLIVPHFRGNAVTVFDLRLGAFGEVVAHIPWVGENPHLAAASPDGSWVVIANYLGDMDGDRASSTLALLDLDPDSPTYLTVPHWIKNR